MSKNSVFLAKVVILCGASLLHLGSPSVSLAAVDCDALSEVGINNASQEELECLVGVGPVYAERIISGRPFSSLDGLQDVQGIGPATVENIQEQGLAVVDSSDDDASGEEEEGTDDSDTEGGHEEEGVESETGDEDDRSVADPSAHTSPVQLSVVEEVPSLAITAGRDRLASVESPVRFSVYAALGERALANADFEWVMGDGSVVRRREFTHRYYAPGTYSVVLTVSVGNEEAISRLSVEVVEPKVSIEGADAGAVTLRSDAEKEVNLGGWRIISEEGSFTIPDNTLIQPNSSLPLTSQVTALQVGEGQEVVLSSPEEGFQDRVAYGESSGGVAADSGDDVHTENERLRAELSYLRQEVTTLAARGVSRQEAAFSEEAPSAPETAMEQTDDSGVASTEDRQVAQDPSVGQLSDDESELGEEEREDGRRVEVVYDGAEENEGGFWSRLLAAPGALFRRFPF